jgi:dTMP kinase
MLDPIEGQGCVVALEGIDGSGTTTHTALLAERLEAEGFTVVSTREPSDGPVGKLIRRGLRGELAMDAATLALLFASDRLEHLERLLRPAVQRGEVVVSDRSLLSSLVYQGMDLPGSWVEEINSRAPWPHLLLWLDVPPDEAVARIARRGQPTERFEEARLLSALHDRYEALCGGRVVRVDGVDRVEKVRARCWSVLEDSELLPRPR